MDAYVARFQYAMLANVIPSGDSEVTCLAKPRVRAGLSSISGMSDQIRCSISKAGKADPPRNGVECLNRALKLPRPSMRSAYYRHACSSGRRRSLVDPDPRTSKRGLRSAIIDIRASVEAFQSRRAVEGQ